MAFRRPQFQADHTTIGTGIIADAPCLTGCGNREVSSYAGPMVRLAGSARVKQGGQILTLQQP